MGANDRYPVPVSDPFVRYEERIKALERRVAELTAARPFQHTAVTGGFLKVIDPTTDDAVRMGLVETFDAVDRYGLQLRAGGTTLFEVNSVDGWRSPALPLAPAPLKALGSGPYVVTTSGSYDDCYRGAGTATHRGITCTVTLACPASTTAEIRLRCANTGTVTDSVACGASSSVVAIFQWLHGLTLGTGPDLFDVQARRLSGAGSVLVYWPQYMAMVTGEVCTDGGLP